MLIPLLPVLASSPVTLGLALALVPRTKSPSVLLGPAAGAILGLRLGEKALPSFYIECLEPAETLGELAEDMLGGCTMERGSKLFDLDWDRKYIHGGK